MFDDNEEQSKFLFRMLKTNKKVICNSNEIIFAWFPPAGKKEDRGKSEYYSQSTTSPHFTEHFLSRHVFPPKQFSCKKQVIFFCSVKNAENTMMSFGLFS